MGGGAGANGSHKGYVSRLDANPNAIWSLVHSVIASGRPAQWGVTLGIRLYP